MDNVYTSGLRQNYPSPALTPTIGVTLGKAHDLSVSAFSYVKYKKKLKTNLKKHTLGIRNMIMHANYTNKMFTFTNKMC